MRVPLVVEALEERSLLSFGSPTWVEQGPGPITNGQTEGQITKLKLVKRQMYGRGKIDLLQARVIGTR